MPFPSQLFYGLCLVIKIWFVPHFTDAYSFSFCSFLCMCITQNFQSIYFNRYRSLLPDYAPNNSVQNSASCNVQGNFHLIKATDLQLGDVEKIGHDCHSPLMLFTTISITEQHNTSQASLLGGAS